MVILPFPKPFLRRLDRLLTAVAYAEAGDLDAVKSLLEQGEAPMESVPETPAARGVEGAKILEFKRAKPVF